MDLVFGSPPEPEIAGGVAMDYFRRLRDRMLVVQDHRRQAQAATGVRQKRGYDTRFLLLLLSWDSFAGKRADVMCVQNFRKIFRR